jgi:hypothetical protein
LPTFVEADALNFRNCGVAMLKVLVAAPILSDGVKPPP